MKIRKHIFIPVFLIFFIIATTVYAATSSTYLPSAQKFINSTCSQKAVTKNQLLSLYCYLFYKVQEQDSTLVNHGSRLTSLETTAATQEAKINLLTKQVQDLAASISALQPTSPQWDMRGTYMIIFTCVSNCVPGNNPHSMTITSMDLSSGQFSGTGYFLTNNAYTWTVTGIVTGSKFTLHLVYNALNMGYYVDVSGTIAPEGTLSGNAKSSTGEIFNLTTTAGAAIHI